MSQNRENFSIQIHNERMLYATKMEFCFININIFNTKMIQYFFFKVNVLKFTKSFSQCLQSQKYKNKNIEIRK